MRALSIETRLYFISVIAAAALAMTASLTWYRADQVVEIGMDKVHIQEAEILLHSLDRIHRDFVTLNDSGQLEKFEKEYAILTGLIEHFAAEADMLGVDVTFLDALSSNVKNLKSLFLTMVEFQHIIGKDQTEGIRKGMRDSLHAAEVVLEKIPDINIRNALHRRLLMTQRAEKDLMLRHQTSYLEKFDNLYALMLAGADEQIVDETLKRDFIDAVSTYRDHFRRFSQAAITVGLTYEDGLRWQLGAVADDAHDNVDEIRRVIAVAALDKEKQIGDVIIGVTVILSMAILLLIHMLGRSIILPLRKMTGVMGRLANGEYEIRIPDKDRRDEIGKMAAALEVFRENAIEHDTAKLSLQMANEKLEERVAERTKSLTASEETLFNIIHESPIAIGLTDENGAPVFWNDSFRKFGWRKDTPGASNDFQLMFAEPDLRRQFFARLNRGEPVRNQEVEIITASEEPAWVEMSIQKLFFEGERSFLTWVHDITERKVREKVQAEAREAAEQANQAKSDFLATMSHEIRTPLNGIMTMAEMLETTELTIEQKGMAVIVRDSSATLVSIVNDVLDFSKIESGNLQLDIINMSLVQVVESVADLLGAQVAEKGIHLLSHIDPEAHDFFEGDPMRLRQILTNLVGNAVKFTETGEVIIKVTVEDSFPDRATAVFKIIDTGIGIPEETQANLFQPFVQADTSIARSFGGTGLGLSISKALVEAMGGEIGVESTPGLGSTFWFKAQMKVKTEQRTSRRGKISGKEAIIVSQNRAFSNILENYMAFAGLKVMTVTDYEKLMASVQVAPEQNRSIDVLMVDGGLPDHAAESLIRKFKANNDMTATQVIAMGYRSHMVVNRPSYLDTVFAELPMPVRRNQLWDVAVAAVGLESLGGDFLYSGRDSGEGFRKFSPPSINAAREAGALILVAEDNPVNQKVIRMLLDRLGYAADIVEDGVLALEAFRNNQYGMVLTDCHMPKMDGYALTRQIREDEKNKELTRIPIVALTADALIGVDEKCRECGMDVSLKKPISKQELNTTILKLLPQASSLRRSAIVSDRTGKQNPATETPPSPQNDADAERLSSGSGGEGRAAFDIAYLNEVTGGDPDMTKILVGSYIDTTPPLIDDLIAAFEAQNADAAREAAHAIKGASFMSGALRLGDICQTIQESAKNGDLGPVKGLKDTLHQEFERFLKAWESRASG